MNRPHPSGGLRPAVPQEKHSGRTHRPSPRGSPEGSPPPLGRRAALGDVPPVSKTTSEGGRVGPSRSHRRETVLPATPNHHKLPPSFEEPNPRPRPRLPKQKRRCRCHLPLSPHTPHPLPYPHAHAHSPHRGKLVPAAPRLNSCGFCNVQLRCKEHVPTRRPGVSNDQAPHFDLAKSSVATSFAKGLQVLDSRPPWDFPSSGWQRRSLHRMNLDSSDRIWEWRETISGFQSPPCTSSCSRKDRSPPACWRVHLPHRAAAADPLEQATRAVLKGPTEPLSWLAYVLGILPIMTATADWPLGWNAGLPVRCVLATSVAGQSDYCPMQSLVSDL